MSRYCDLHMHVVAGVGYQIQRFYIRFSIISRLLPVGEHATRGHTDTDCDNRSVYTV